jgi:hypothetical protein
MSKPVAFFLANSFATRETVGYTAGSVSVKPSLDRCCLRPPLGALLLVLSASGPARATEGGVQLDCPELSREGAGELESRVRASLLTTDVRANIVIACGAGSAEVRASADSDSTSRQITTTPASLRDDVLRAVDDALQELARRRQGTAAAVVLETPAPQAREEPPKNEASPAVAAPAARPSRRAPPKLVQQPASTSATELFASVAGEAWSSELAFGLLLGVRRGLAPFWYGVHAGALRPFEQDPQFGLTELSAAAEAQVSPEALRGVRLGLAAGPSLLLVAPHGAVTTRQGNSSVALFFDAELSRPFWLGHLALVPAFGVRWLTSERGVKLDAEERFTLGGFTPHLALGVLYRTD